MKLRKTIKKIMSLGVGATMMGATILGASAAADLANYPEPFVKDGKFNAILVVGDAAASSDVIGSVDVATSMQYASKVKREVTATGSAAISAIGDSWKVRTSSNDLEMSENIEAGGTPNAETIRDISKSIGSAELDILSDGTFRNDKGDFDYKQYIYFDDVNTAAAAGSLTSRTVVYATDDGDVTSDFFFVESGEQVARYVLDFVTSAETDLTDSTGATGTGYLWNLQGETINMLGTDYSIVSAKNTTGRVELTLMAGSVRDILQEGETKTYTVGDKDYEVTLVFTSATQAKFTVDGEATDSISEGGTDILSDGTQMGVRDILYQDFAGGVHQAEFYLGADKIILKDSDVTDGASSDYLRVNEENIEYAGVVIRGTRTASAITIASIEINVTADQDVYVGPGEKLSDKMLEPEGMLGRWDIEYQGLAETATETIKIKTSGSDEYELEFVDGNGNSVDVPLVYTSGSTNLRLGSSSAHDLILNENATISRNDYFIVSATGEDDGEEDTFLYKYTGSSVSDSVVRFINIGTGDTEEITFTPVAIGAGSGIGVLRPGGGFTFAIWNSTSGNNFPVYVDLDGDETLEANQDVTITTNGGAKIAFSASPANMTGVNMSTDGASYTGGTLDVTISTPSAEDYDNKQPTNLVFQIGAATSKVTMDQDSTDTFNYISPEGEDYTEYTYTSLGAKVKFDDPTSDPETVTIDYPTQQRLPQLFVTSGGVTFSSTEGTEGAIVYYETTPIEVGAAKLASEVTSLAAQNTILVGGPCANPLAAQAMGNPADCTEGFEEGKAILKLFEQSTGNVALLVAGYSAMDTRRACRVLADYETWQEADKLKGMEVEIAGTSFTDITVSAPAPVTTTTTTTTTTETETETTVETETETTTE
ncbi:hypothetical protein JXB11_04880 [Candidatus Woesearchaeota archaeon]|nr:hypothetical protein [Candidatus Woesearchaeota archaeon]